ncbi:MAG TPA: ADOP family duplicated permease, partial [Gemmatimonadales bacterium]|nr:ADOP family duplicated permease [Gemmatimonadales bacterium]
MSWLTRVGNVLRPGRYQRELERELQFHLAETTDRLIAGGMPPAEAAREASRRFGHVAGIRDRTRDIDIMTWLESLLADLRYSARALRAAPAFTVVALLSLGLGIGANTAIFSLVDAVMLRSLPVTRPEQLVKVAMGSGDENDVFTNPLWEQIRDRAGVFDGAFAFSTDRFNLATTGQSRMVEGHLVSGDYFRTLGVGSAIGRLLEVSDDRRGCPPLAVISHGFWQSEFGGSPSVLGSSIPLNGQPFTVIGVTDRGFTGVAVGGFPLVYVPLCAEPLVHGAPGMLDERSAWWLQIIGRLAPHGTVAQVSAQLTGASSAIFEATRPSNWGAGDLQEYLKTTLRAVPAATGLSDLRLRYRTALVVLMVVVGVVLLIACANVANLLLARAAAREREIAMRLAIGASRGRIVRQMLTESLLLASLGALLGLGFARWSSNVLVGLLQSRGAPVSLDLSLDHRLLAFTLLAAVATGLLFGMAPAWRSVRQDPQGVLKVGGLPATATRGMLTAGKLLVIGQVALSLVLVAVAGLLLGTFRSLAALNPGFRPAGVVLAEVDFQSLNLSAETRFVLGRQLLERIRATPGVIAASGSVLTPVSGRRWNSFVLVDGYVPAGERDNLVWFNGVTDGYFATLGTRFLAGRDFTPQDGATTQRVAVVTRSLARKFFGDSSPLGRRFRVQAGAEPGPPVEIVGVVDDARYRSLRDTMTATVFIPWAQTEHFGHLVYEVRSRSETGTIVAGVLDASHEVLPAASLGIS